MGGAQYGEEGAESEVAHRDDQTLRGDSEEGGRGGLPELPLVSMPPERPPDDANAKMLREYKGRLQDVEQVSTGCMHELWSLTEKDCMMRQINYEMRSAVFSTFDAMVEKMRSLACRFKIFSQTRGD